MGGCKCLLSVKILAICPLPVNPIQTLDDHYNLKKNIRVKASRSLIVTLFYLCDKFKLFMGSSCLQIYSRGANSLQLFVCKHDKRDAVKLIQKQSH